MKIVLSNLNFSYDSEHILKDINLTINQGEKVTIVGHSGSGKTTLMNILSNLVKNPNIKYEIQGQQIDDKKLLVRK